MKENSLLNLVQFLSKKILAKSWNQKTCDIFFLLLDWKKEGAKNDHTTIIKALYLNYLKENSLLNLVQFLSKKILAKSWNQKTCDIFFLLLDWKKEAAKIDNTPQELRREGWTETAVILCKLNKSL